MVHSRLVDYFIPARSIRKETSLVSIYVREFVSWYGVPMSIISYHGLFLDSEFWRSLHEALGTELSLSNADDPQTDG